MQSALGSIRGGREVFFVAGDCESAATRAQTAGHTWIFSSWINYKHRFLGSPPLTDDEKRAIAIGTYDPTDIAAQANKELLR